ncbi:MAG: hypothetical protein HRU46_21540 [Verrucomicrobiales bacterium]|nr:hypothetical protein [Verrucomicrobiales bacterium]
MQKKKVLTLFTIGGVVGFFALVELWRQAENDVADPADKSGLTLTKLSPIAAKDQDLEQSVEPPLPLDDEFQNSSAVSRDSSAASDSSADLLNIIPAWLRESGEVLREQIEINGQLVDRVRSRYEWNSGELVEVEVLDLGETATEEQFMSLGFDVNFKADDGEVERLLKDGENYVINMEFSKEDLEGCVQVIVGGRYLMEVQMEGLPFEAFQALEDRDTVFGSLLQRAENQ